VAWQNAWAGGRGNYRWMPDGACRLDACLRRHDGQVGIRVRQVVWSADLQNAWAGGRSNYKSMPHSGCSLDACVHTLW